MIGRDFEPFKNERLGRTCSECGERILVGAVALRSVRGGVTKKIVCGQVCADAFDAAYWDYVSRSPKSARLRASQRPKRPMFGPKAAR